MRPKYTPKPHQQKFLKAVLHAKRPEVQGTLALHGTGTGKTFSSIAAFEELKERGKAKRALVITPAGLRANFLNKGINKFTTSKGQIITRPQELSPDVEYAVVSYAAFRRRPQEFIDALKPDTLIADEIQKAINEKSITHKTLMQARTQIPRFMGLTASPVSNEPAELVPLLALATAGEHPIKTRKQFKKRFIETKTDKKRRGIFGGKVKTRKVVNIQKLKESIGDTVHYVEDLDATEKPAKNLQTVEVPMSKEQIKLYEMSMKGLDPKIVAKIKAGEAVSQTQAMHVFSRLMRARQVSNSIHIGGGKTLSQSAEQTPKIKRILDDAAEHLSTVPDGKIIIYSNIYKGGVDVISAGLKKRGIPFGVFSGRGRGGLTEEKRQQNVEDYIAGKTRVLIITSAGSEGLSLGNTTMVQVAEGHYNPERTAQAEARGIRAGGLAHRPVAERQVAVRRYVSTMPRTFWQKLTFKQPEKSVGQWVYATAERKAKMNRQLRAALRARSEHEERKRESKFYRLTHRKVAQSERRAYLPASHRTVNVVKGPWWKPVAPWKPHTVREGSLRIAKMNPIKRLRPVEVPKER
jgi:SNF2 family DNA or RNA helicase